MLDINLPSVVTFEAGETSTGGRLIVEPLYPGYGTTVGNALRRVLLSSLPGAAVTAVKIAGAPHEFAALPKVAEDMLQIIMNLKELRMRVFSDEPIKLHLAAKGEKAVTAKDIDKNSDVEIVNPELTIATLTAKDAAIEMDIWVAKGRGYQMTETGDAAGREIGTIAVDSFFSPVRRVSFIVESARVGQMINYDRLLMNIETDATLTPEEAVKDATKVLVAQFAAVGKVNEMEVETLVADTDTEEEVQEVSETVSEETSEKEEALEKKNVKKATKE
ncbi:DNA-directed RNA polymerase subunit alpha [Candidatus Uhrbacteria bacterium CG10_big_fil_rev_8_21_14_0_10_48_11]|uniref:DNA-directed RNA polymerase subunit alpha n=1 Tax=Candidatus Uhrbacteria bacterium CG10_big_fil_rev_8_21_14_0_10_48_11 TaxID=1975037 RepID=A0A2M8LEJ7_9BACT|nr:MAG: DNA-directed RNA polymerase subunit alpha [Candidatus Uhrbacteria bacterium CG10_big_fil_rev_8_21_14_0_10_48_11]